MSRLLALPDEAFQKIIDNLEQPTDIATLEAMFPKKIHWIRVMRRFFAGAHPNWGISLWCWRDLAKGETATFRRALLKLAQQVRQGRRHPSTDCLDCYKGHQDLVDLDDDWCACIRLRGPALSRQRGQSFQIL